MFSPKKTNEAHSVWTEEDWERLERETRTRALNAASDEASWLVINGRARKVMRLYSTSFFIVSRFLPARKRAEVEAIYAAVRYPDEIVDTFPLKSSERAARLQRWQESYEAALSTDSIKDALEQNVPCFLSSFTRVVREREIPPEHYRSFLDAMMLDVAPRRFETLDDLIDSYIYGSAIVVGYFLAYVYGSASEKDFARALRSARHLGIALQLTNFLRDVCEDERRGRVYLPQDLLRAEGIEELDTKNPAQHTALARVLRRVTSIAGQHYSQAQADLDAFAPDCRMAIHACIKVYGKLNERIGRGGESGIHRRESVPLREKLSVLPPSKYWRIPLAYLKN